MPATLRVLIPALVALALPLAAQKGDGPQPRYVAPGDATHPPADAVLLFNGHDMKGWVNKDGQPTHCDVAHDVITCASGSGDMYTTEKFGSAQIHLEFSPPSMPDQHGQLRGNSGVYLQSQYEIQILDSYQNPTYANGSLGAVYGQAPPLVNVARPPGQWETYDIIFHAPRCDASGNIAAKGTVTVILNGVLVQDHVTIESTKGGCAAAPLMLQDHSGFKGAPVTHMRFRNLWYRPLDDPPAK